MTHMPISIGMTPDGHTRDDVLDVTVVLRYKNGSTVSVRLTEVGQAQMTFDVIEPNEEFKVGPAPDDVLRYVPPKKRYKFDGKATFEAMEIQVFNEAVLGHDFHGNR